MVSGKHLIGLKAKGGVKITELSEHSVERGVSPTGMKQAIKSPLNNLEVKIDEKGQKSIKYVGEAVTVIVNPSTGKVITGYKTGKRVRKIYKGE